jgi:hypothetical protein
MFGSVFLTRTEDKSILHKDFTYSKSGKNSYGVKNGK